MFAGSTKDALVLQQNALESIEDPSLQNERYIAGEWTYNFMPPYATDDQSINRHISISDNWQKRVFIHYNLSFGYALNRDFQAATIEFHLANKLDEQNDYNPYFVNKMQSLRNHVEMDEDVQRWFETHEQMLSTP